MATLDTLRKPGCLQLHGGRSRLEGSRVQPVGGAASTLCTCRVRRLPLFVRGGTECYQEWSVKIRRGKADEMSRPPGLQGARVTSAARARQDGCSWRLATLVCDDVVNSLCNGNWFILAVIRYMKWRDVFLQTKTGLPKAWRMASAQTSQIEDCSSPAPVSEPSERS